MGNGLAGYVTTLDEDLLAQLLQRRPGLVRGLAPSDMSELVDRLGHPRMIAEALHEVTLPHLQLVQAACALHRSTRTTAQLAELVGTDEGSLEPFLEDLAELALLARDGKLIVLPETMATLFDDPLGLGPSLAELLETQSVDRLRKLQRVHGLDTPKRRADVLESLLTFYGEPRNVAAILEQAPPAVLETLRGNADDGHAHLRTQDAYRRMREATLWAEQHGLIVPDPYAYVAQLPAEVVRALRGPDWHAPFDPEPPPVHRPAQAPIAGGSELPRFAASLLDVVDHIARAPVPLVKSGGVGVRELAKLAKTCGADDVTARLALELAAAIGAVVPDGDRLCVTDGFAAWRSSPPAEQAADIVRAWWTLGHSPTETVDEDGKAMRALARLGDHCGGCVAARAAVVGTLADSGPLESADLAALALWRRPLVHALAQDGDRPLSSVIAEALTLGVIAGTALTDVGRALHAGDDDAVLAAAEAQLPAATEQATFGSDLTAFVAGTPGARVSALLDSAADRESRGGAVTWRFSPASVRRALDDGATGDDLVAGLRQVATAELPQPLRYLLTDIARRHGSLRLSAATSVVRSDDAALLAEVAADRKLAKLGVRLLAPTVLGAGVPVTTLLDALRKAGYLPIVEDSAPADDARAPSVRRRPGAPTAPASFDEADARQLARALLAGPRAGVRPATSLSARMLAGYAPGLSSTELRLLAHAVDTGGRVGIDYVSATGSPTSRVISEAVAMGPTLSAWCELRNDERVFTISRIRSVYAPG